MSSANQIPALQGRLEKARAQVDAHRRVLIADKERLNDTSMTQYASNLPRIAAPPLKQRRTLKGGHLNKITSISWSADSSQVLSAGQDGKLILWDAESTNKVNAINLQSSWVMTCAMSPSGKLVASGGLDNICSVYDLKAAEAAMSQNPGAIIPPTKSLDAHVGFISGIKFLSDQQLLTSSGDQTSALWDIERGVMVKQFSGHSKDVMGLALLRDNSGYVNNFVTASGDRTARLWDMRTGRAELMFNIGEENADLLCIDAFPDSQAFATGGEDGVVRFFDIRSEVQLMSYLPPGANDDTAKTVTGVSFTHSGKAIVVGYETDSIRLFDTLRGDQISMIKAHEERVSAVAVSPDGNALATGSWDKIIKIWA